MYTSISLHDDMTTTTTTLSSPTTTMDDFKPTRWSMITYACLPRRIKQTCCTCPFILFPIVIPIIVISCCAYPIGRWTFGNVFDDDKGMYFVLGVFEQLATLFALGMLSVVCYWIHLAIRNAIGGWRRLCNEYLVAIDESTSLTMGHDDSPTFCRVIRFSFHRDRRAKTLTSCPFVWITILVCSGVCTVIGFGTGRLFAYWLGFDNYNVWSDTLLGLGMDVCILLFVGFLGFLIWLLIQYGHSCCCDGWKQIENDMIHERSNTLHD